MNRALAYYGLVDATTVESGDITGVQAGLVVSAGQNIFKPEQVGRTIVFDSGEACVITDYTSPTAVQVQPAQTVAVGPFRILPAAWHRLGRAYSSEVDASYLDFGVSGREKELHGYSAMLAVGSHAFDQQLQDAAYLAALTQGKETGLTMAVEAPFVTGDWMRLGRFNVSSVSAKVTYTRYTANSGDPFNAAAYTQVQVTDQALVSGTNYEVDTANGRVRLLAASPFTLAIVSGTVTFTFNCAAAGSSIEVALWGGVSPTKPLRRLFTRAITDPLSGFHIKTHFRKYVFQDRITVAGAHNPARLQLRSFEIQSINSSQIGRQNRA